MSFPHRVFSGIQPTGNLHLGNYLGAIRNWVPMQGQVETIFCIVDLHAITLPQDPQELRAQTREVTAAYIAAGIDPERSIIFNQSAVTGHSELAWLLGCLTPLGWLNAALLAGVLARRGWLRLDARLRQRSVRLAVAVAVMTGALLLARAGLAEALAGATALRAAALAGLIAGGAALFVGSAQLLGALDAAELWRALRRGEAAQPAA